MSIWIPPDSDFALALREPGLLVPGGRAKGEVNLKDGMLRPDWAWLNVTPYSSPRDLVSGTAYAVLNTGGSVTPGPNYWEFAAGGSQDRINLGSIDSSHPLSFTSADGFTLIADVYVGPTQTTGFGRVIDKSNGGSCANGWDLDWVQAQNRFEFGINSSYLGLTPTATNARHRVVITYHPSERLRCYVHYANAWQTPVDGPPTAVPTTTTNAAIGHWNHSTTDRSWQGFIYGIATYNRVLPLEDAQRIALNMHGTLLRPANDAPYPFPVAGGGGVSLTVQSANHGHIADAPTLVQAHAMTPAEASHAHSSESPTLTQANALGPEDAAHGHSAESPALSAAGTLEPADAAHAHSAESPTIVQAHVLVVLESTHAHTADNVTLTIGGSLDVADALHGHVVDQPTLTQANAIAPADSTHGHAAESPALTQTNSLSPADATHGHAADQPTLDLSVYLSPSEATHAHAADAPTITQAHILAVDEALHAHYADSPLLPQDYTIVVSDTLHAHLTASPNLILGTLPLMSGRVYLSRATLRVYRPTKRLNS